MSSITIPSILWVVLFVTLVPPLSEWIGKYVAEPWNFLIVIILGALAKTAEVLLRADPLQLKSVSERSKAFKIFIGG